MSKIKNLFNIHTHTYTSGKTVNKSDSIKMYKYEKKNTSSSSEDDFSYSLNYLSTSNISVFKCENIKPLSRCMNF